MESVFDFGRTGHWSTMARMCGISICTVIGLAKTSAPGVLGRRSAHEHSDGDDESYHEARHRTFLYCALLLQGPYGCFTGGGGAHSMFQYVVCVISQCDARADFKHGWGSDAA